MNHKRYFEQGDWVAEVVHQFALWINACLKRRFKSIKQDFATQEYNQWCKEMKYTISTLAHLHK